jgi:hypothetical protein
MVSIVQVFRGGKILLLEFYEEKSDYVDTYSSEGWGKINFPYLDSRHGILTPYFPSLVDALQADEAGWAWACVAGVSSCMRLVFFFTS